MKKIVSHRFDEDLIAWASEYAASHGWDRTRLIEELLRALYEGRVDVRPRAGVDPFPLHTVELGSTPECPALIWVGEKNAS